MKKAIGVFLGIVLSAAMSFAQSSGNFSYGNTGTTHCVLNNGTGEITGGDICSAQSGTAGTGNADCLLPRQTCIISSGTTGICGVTQPDQKSSGGLAAGIKNHGGRGKPFRITPSAVGGLLAGLTVQR